MSCTFIILVLVVNLHFPLSVFLSMLFSPSSLPSPSDWSCSLLSLHPGKLISLKDSSIISITDLMALHCLQGESKLFLWTVPPLMMGPQPSFLRLFLASTLCFWYFPNPCLCSLCRMSLTFSFLKVRILHGHYPSWSRSRAFFT